jgi:hypothetical protein
MDEVRQFLAMIANVMMTAPRHGGTLDVPEGARWIQLSDSLANRIARDAAGLALRIVPAGTKGDSVRQPN